jgi:hypothetical protein
VNPQRRAHVAGIAGAAALVLLGAGIGIGWAAAPSGRDHGHYRMHMLPGYGVRPDLPGYFPRHFPGPPGTATAVPAPSGTPTK